MGVLKRGNAFMAGNPAGSRIIGCQGQVLVAFKIFQQVPQISNSAVDIIPGIKRILDP
jgi:hypothetical protein